MLLKKKFSVSRSLVLIKPLEGGFESFFSPLFEDKLFECVSPKWRCRPVPEVTVFRIGASPFELQMVVSFLENRGKGVPKGCDIWRVKSPKLRKCTVVLFVWNVAGTLCSCADTVPAIVAPSH